jgi:glyoxylase-like metal-dependent hydrolase (beta-lactamase superfamily II)
VTALKGGEEVEGCRVEYAPGHARHHVVYLEQSTGDLMTGDVAGVRIPPSELVVAPTPPPEIDVEAWLRSLELVAQLEPRRLCLTHAGGFEDVDRHLADMESWLREAVRRSAPGDAEAFDGWVRGRIGPEGAEVVERIDRTAPPDHLWLGLERYWRKRREAEAADAAA